jgi:hypothetical protein
VAQLERDAATQPRSQAQYMLQAAQQYRNYYNQNCTGSGGGGYSGGSGGGVDKGAAIQGILGNLANMAAIMERSRLRQESEAREQALQGEIERLEREEAENRRKAEAEWQAKADKDADDRRRAAIPNPFLNADGRIPESENPFAPTGEVVIDNPFAGPPTGVSANCARNSNPSMCELLEKTDAYDKRMGRKLAEGSAHEAHLCRPFKAACLQRRPSRWNPAARMCASTERRRRIARTCTGRVRKPGARWRMSRASRMARRRVGWLLDLYMFCASSCT